MNIKEVLLKAKNEKYAIPQFNINNLEWAKYILEVCEEEKSPVFLGVSSGAAKYMGGFDVVVGMVNGLKKDLNITVPVMLHLDHATTFELCKNAVDAGFDSIMFDGSKGSYEDNIKITNEVKNYLKGQLLEAEIGKIGGEEDGIANELYFTSLEEAEDFISKTNIDMLAPTLGSVHGIYKGEPDIKLDIMKEISDKTNMPLVLHGGSGVPDEQIKMAVEAGIRKMNFSTDLCYTFIESVQEQDKNKIAIDLIMKEPIEKVKEFCLSKIDVLGSRNRV